MKRFKLFPVAYNVFVRSQTGKKKCFVLPRGGDFVAATDATTCHVHPEIRVLTLRLHF